MTVTSGAGGSAAAAGGGSASSKSSCGRQARMQTGQVARSWTEHVSMRPAMLARQVMLLQGITVLHAC